MKTSARKILSTLSGLIFVATVGIAVATAGFASITLLLGLAALVPWALFQLVLLDLAPRLVEKDAKTPGEIVEYPSVGEERRQAA